MVERMTTVVIGEKRLWDLGEGEFPGKNDRVLNAFTVRKTDVQRLRAGLRGGDA